MKNLSPCINVCKIDNNSGYCEGCFRKPEEIFNWVKFSTDEQLSILQNVEKRKSEVFDEV